MVFQRIGQSVLECRFQDRDVALAVSDGNGVRQREEAKIFTAEGNSNFKWLRVYYDSVFATLASLDRHPIISCQFDKYFALIGQGFGVFSQRTFTYNGLVFSATFDSLSKFGKSYKQARPHVVGYRSYTLEGITVSGIEMGQHSIKGIINLVSGIGQFQVNDGRIVHIHLGSAHLITSTTEGVVYDQDEGLFSIGELILPIELLVPIYYEENFYLHEYPSWEIVRDANVFDFKPSFINSTPVPP